MSEHIFKRPFNKKENIYMINYKKSDGTRVRVAKEIEKGFPDKKFKVVCHEDKCHVLFKEDLNDKDQNKLKEIIHNHIDNCEKEFTNG